MSPHRFLSVNRRDESGFWAVFLREFVETATAFIWNAHWSWVKVGKGRATN